VIRRLSLGLLLVLAACNRSGVADVTLDADAAQRNATAAKTLDDLAAATAASRGPAPVVRDAEPVNTQAEATSETRKEPTTERQADTLADTEDQADTPSNDTAQPDTETR
jgi:hypothetical protein